MGWNHPGWNFRLLMAPGIWEQKVNFEQNDEVEHEMDLGSMDNRNLEFVN